MDYKDYIVLKGKNDFFWHEARRGLINIMLSLVYEKYDSSRKILEIGCGTGSNLSVLGKWGKVSGLEINPIAVSIAKGNGFNVKVGDIEKRGLCCVDAICLFDVLEHIKNENVALNNIYSSLNPRGHLFLTVPAFNFLFSDHDKAMNHFRRYDMKELIFLLEKNGFEIKNKNYWNFLLFPPIAIVRICKNYINCFFKKKKYNSDASILHPLISKAFFVLLILENYLVKNDIKFSYGLSICIIAKKK